MRVVKFHANYTFLHASKMGSYRKIHNDSYKNNTEIFLLPRCSLISCYYYNILL